MHTLELLNKLDGNVSFVPQGLKFCLKGNARQAKNFVLNTADSIVVSLKKMGLEYAEIYYSGAKIPFKLCVEMAEVFEMTNRIAVPSVFIGDVQVTPGLRPSIEYILQNPDKKLALTRIIHRDQILITPPWEHENGQIMLSSSSANAMKSDGKEAVKRRTSDFWQSEDLDRLRQHYRDHGSGFTLTYVASTNKPKFDETAEWARFTTKYDIVEDDFGIVYRVGEIIDLVQIDRPMAIA